MSSSPIEIDDEAAIRESLETLLELEGYGVESAASGEEGLARIGDRSRLGSIESALAAGR